MGESVNAEVMLKLMHQLWQRSDSLRVSLLLREVTVVTSGVSWEAEVLVRRGKSYLSS
jgi:hypothetical protein